MATELSEEQMNKVKHDFRRCREGTADAIIRLRQTGDTALIPQILRGIVWRYVRPEAREQVVFFKLLVIILHEALDDIGSAGKNGRIESLLRIK